MFSFFTEKQSDHYLEKLEGKDEIIAELTVKNTIQKYSLAKINRELSQEKEKTQKNFYKYNFSERDIYLIAAIVSLEAGDYNTDRSQRGVASVIINRYEFGHWNSAKDKDETPIYNIIFARGQFSPAHKIKSHLHEPSERVYNNVKYVLKNGSILPDNVMYFCTPKIYKRFNRKKYMEQDGIVYCY